MFFYVPWSLTVICHVINRFGAWPTKDTAVYVTFEGQKLRGQLFKRSKRGQRVV